MPPKDKISEALDQLATEIVTSFVDKLTPMLREQALKIVAGAGADELDKMARSLRSSEGVTPSMRKLDDRSLAQMVRDIIEERGGQIESVEALQGEVKKFAWQDPQSISKTIRDMKKRGQLLEGASGVITLGNYGA